MYEHALLCLGLVFFFFSSRRRHTRCALVTGVQTCALPISSVPMLDRGLPVGVMLLERAADAEPFTAQDLLMAETIAALVAPGIALKPRAERWIGGRVRRHGRDGAKARFGQRRPLGKGAGCGTLMLLPFLVVRSEELGVG